MPSLLYLSFEAIASAVARLLKFSSKLQVPPHVYLSKFEAIASAVARLLKRSKLNKGSSK